MLGVAAALTFFLVVIIRRELFRGWDYLFFIVN